MDGHTVIAFPVPELDPWVRTRTAHYDASFLSGDPAFAHAHITLLAPWVPAPTTDDLDRVARIARRYEPFVVTLARVSTFPNGLLHLRPQPDAPIRSLTADLAAAWPQCPPYAGAFEPIPHLTLDRLADDVTVGSTTASLGTLVPLAVRLDRLDLQWWANDDCRLLHSWRLGSS